MQIQGILNSQSVLLLKSEAIKHTNTLSRNDIVRLIHECGVIWVRVIYAGSDGICLGRVRGSTGTETSWTNEIVQFQPDYVTQVLRP